LYQPLISSSSEFKGGLWMHGASPSPPRIISIMWVRI
jgi:hypothetical protein